MRILYVLTFMIVISPTAFAQQITIEAMCEQISENQPESAEYKPGVDVDGNPVASADINAPLEPVIYPMVIPIEIDVLKFLNLTPPDSLNDAGNLEADTAFLTLYEDGRLDYNGQDISSSADYLCVNSDTLPPAQETPPEPAKPKVQPSPKATPEKPAPETKTENKAAEPVKKDDTPASEPVKSSAEMNTEFKTLLNSITEDEPATDTKAE